VTASFLGANSAPLGLGDRRFGSCVSRQALWPANRLPCSSYTAHLDRWGSSRISTNGASRHAAKGAPRYWGPLRVGPILEKEVEVEVEVENLKTVVEANASPGRSSVDGNSG
jgi:hypothetical protein